MPELVKHLAVDMDDVVLDFIGGVRRVFETEFGEEGIPDYEGSPWGASVVAFTKHPRLLEAGYKSWWDWLRERDWLWATFDAVPGAIGGLRQLRHEGYYLEMVTSKPAWAEPNVWKWLGKWKPPFHSVTIVGSGERKVDVTNADLIVDDKLQTCQEFVADGREAVIFDRGLNHLDQGHRRNLYHAQNWSEVLHEIHKTRVEVVYSGAQATALHP